MITEAMIRKGYGLGLVKVVDSPYGDGAVCQIGESWFYFWSGLGSPDELIDPPAEVLLGRFSTDAIVHEIWDALERSKRELEFAEEYDYYKCVLMEGVEGLRDVNEVLCPFGAAAQEKDATEGVSG